jgi:hypothetical protein
VYGVPAAATLLLLAEPVFGASPGKLACGLAVRGRGGASAVRSRRWRRFLVKTSPAWSATAALVLGSWALALVAAGTAVLLGGAILVALARGRPLPHDAAAGTEVA